MLIRFVRDYQGVLTGEVFYGNGAEVDFDAEVAPVIIREGAAVAVEILPPDPVPQQATVRRGK